MADFSLVPVDHQPDFADVSLVPVDHDPFSADGATQQTQNHQAQAQPQIPLQPPATGAGQPDVGAPAVGGSAPGGSQGGADPAPFGGYANPTPTDSLVNKAKMDDQEKLIETDRTGKNGRVIDGGDLYKFVTTRQPIAHYLIDGNTGTVFTEISPFYAKEGSRYATIDASPERPVTVTVRGDGTFTISRP